MSKFNKLAALNEIAEQLENTGHSVEATIIHKQFMKLAQMADEMNTISTKEMTDDILGEYNAQYDDEYRANGPNMQKAIAKIQSNLLLQADGLFGPSTSYAIVKALDGINPEKNLDKAYVQRAREFVQSLQAGFVTKLKGFVSMKKDIRSLEKEPLTRSTEIEPSNLKLKLIEELGDYKG